MNQEEENTICIEKLSLIEEIARNKANCLDQWHWINKVIEAQGWQIYNVRKDYNEYCGNKLALE